MKLARNAAVVLIATSPIFSANAEVDTRAEAAIERSRQTQATYSLFSWNIITPQDGGRLEEWSAEFNRGSEHRVETPRDRLVADCSARTGTHLSVLTGEVTSGVEIARAACGIESNSPALSVSYDGRVDTEFGPVDALTISDPNFVRTYLVTDEGALVGQTIETPNRTVLLDLHARAVFSSVPEGIFTVASLQESAVPAEYRAPPN